MDKDTKKCISIAEKPGTFGVHFHNEGYSLLGLNYVYFPLKVKSKQLKGIMNLVRENFKGCSVSMPHKETVIRYLDELDEYAQKIGAVNTVLNIEGKLRGYNTDYYGAKKSISKTQDILGEEVLMLGAGGVARAIGHAVKDLGGKLTISNRTTEKAKRLAKELDAETINWGNRNKVGKRFLLINATNMGFYNSKGMPLDKESIENYNSVMDVIVGETLLIQKANELGKTIITGKEMTVYQAAAQFEIYTLKTLPENFLNKFLGKNKK